MARLSREQFERLVHVHQAAVFRSARRLAGDDAVAADIVQDVFLRVLEGKERLELARDERALLCWLAVRLAGNARRAGRRRHHHEEHAMTIANTADPSDPLSDAVRAELHRSVVAIVEALPDELRTPLLLRCQDALPLAAIGSALGAPVSTVHDRITQATERVRRALAERGHAVAPAAVPGLLGAVEPAAPPLALTARLLALAEAPLSLAGGVLRRAAVASLAGLVAVAAVVAATWSPSSVPVPTVAARGTVIAAAEGQDPSVPPPRLPAPPAQVPSPAQAGTPQLPVVAASTFEGVVRDAEAWPVAGATVHAVAGGGLKAFALATPVTTDAKGRFVVSVQPSDWAPTALRLLVVEGTRHLLETGDLRLPRAAGAPLLELQVPAAVGAASSRYELSVVVTDAQGAAIAGVPVQLATWCEPAPAPGWGSREAEASTGADGTAALRGRGLGAKWLFVDGRERGLQSSYVRFDVGSAGAHRHTVVLAPGRSWSARVLRVDGEPLDDVTVRLRDEATGLTHAGVRGAAQSYAFTGLGDGTYVLHAQAGSAWSPAAIVGVRARDPERTVRLKPIGEARDLGDHQAELHGELVDADTGAVVPFGPFALEVMPVRSGASTSPLDRLQPQLAVQQLEASRAPRRTFHEVGLGAGRCAVVADVPGYAIAVHEVDLGVGEIQAGIRVPLQRPAAVQGRVVDMQGQPVAGALVFVLGEGALADACLGAWAAFRFADEGRGAVTPSLTKGAARTGADGRFELTRVPAGLALRLVAQHDGHGLAVQALPALRVGERLLDQDLRTGAR